MLRARVPHAGLRSVFPGQLPGFHPGLDTARPAAVLMVAALAVPGAGLPGDTGCSILCRRGLAGRSAWQNYKHAWEAKGERFDLASFAPPPVPTDQNFFETPLWNDLHFVETNGVVGWSDKDWGSRVIFRHLWPQQITSPQPRQLGRRHSAWTWPRGRRITAAAITCSPPRSGLAHQLLSHRQRAADTCR